MAGLREGEVQLDLNPLLIQCIRDIEERCACSYTIAACEFLNAAMWVTNTLEADIVIEFANTLDVMLGFTRGGVIAEGAKFLLSFFSNSKCVYKLPPATFKLILQVDSSELTGLLIIDYIQAILQRNASQVESEIDISQELADPYISDVEKDELLLEKQEFDPPIELDEESIALIQNFISDFPDEELFDVVMTLLGQVTGQQNQAPEQFAP